MALITKRFTKFFNIKKNYSGGPKIYSLSRGDLRPKKKKENFDEDCDKHEKKENVN